MSLANILGQLVPESHTKTPGAYGHHEPQAKIKRAIKKHRCDHSNPGGTVSMWFREKRSKL